jgi:hypothetical protein
MREIVWCLVSALLLGCGTGRTSQWEGRPAVAASASVGGQTAAAGSPQTPDQLLAAADTAWAGRGDRAALESAIGFWEQALGSRPDDGATLARLSRAYYFLADGHLRKLGTKSDAYLGTFEKGTAAAERALAASSPAFKAKVVGGEPVEQAIQVVGREGLEAMYWYAVNLGKWSRAKGFAATLGNKDRVKGVMTRALALDPGFFHAAPHRYFGAFYSVAPGFAGGDVNKSKEHFETSLKLAPNYAGTKILMAETYATKVQDAGLFDRLLAEVLAMPDGAIPGLEPETRVEKEKALELKAKREELF